MTPDGKTMSTEEQLTDLREKLKVYQVLRADCEKHHDCCAANDEKPCGTCDNCERAEHYDKWQAAEEKLKAAEKELERYKTNVDAVAKMARDFIGMETKAYDTGDGNSFSLLTFVRILGERKQAAEKREGELREAIKTHAECTTYCPTCGEGIPCADDDVIMALAKSKPEVK